MGNKSELEIMCDTWTYSIQHSNESLTILLNVSDQILSSDFFSMNF